MNHVLRKLDILETFSKIFIFFFKWESFSLGRSVTSGGQMERGGRWCDSYQLSLAQGVTKGHSLAMHEDPATLPHLTGAAPQPGDQDGTS